MPVIAEQVAPTTEAADQQLRSPVPRQVREHRSRAGPMRLRQPGLRRDIGEPPAAEVPIKPVGPRDRAKVQVTPSIPVEISSRHAGTIGQVYVPH